PSLFELEMILEPLPLSINFAATKPITNPTNPIIIPMLSIYLLKIIKKKAHIEGRFVQTPINRFRANSLLKYPYTSRARFYNLNSPFSNKLVLSLSKINYQCGQ